jgi:hypothetical protein
VSDLVAAATGRAADPAEAVRAAGRLPAAPVPLSVLAREALVGDTR